LNIAKNFSSLGINPNMLPPQKGWWMVPKINGAR
jgi:hypothetical protein